MFAPRYFAPRYFASRYFPSGFAAAARLYRGMLVNIGKMMNP